MRLNESFLERRFFLCFLLILIIAMQVSEASSLLMAESTIKSSGEISYSNSSSATRPLHVEGNRIKDNLGNTVYLRGVNRERAADHPSGCWGGWAQYKQSKVELILGKMHEYGVNCIRYLISAEWWINNPTVATEQGDMTFRQILDDLLTRCENHGIYFIICTWTVEASTHDDMAYPPYTDSNLVPNAAAFRNYIVEQVDVLGSYANLIIEPYNEPFSGSDWNTPQRLDEWHTVWQDILTSMRAKEDAKGYVHHLFVAMYNGLAYWGDLSKEWMNFNWINEHDFTDPAGNVVYSAHCYRYHGSVGTQEPKDTRPTAYDAIKAIYVEQKMYYWSTKKPIFIGEIGAFNVGGEETWLENTLRIWNEWYLGYAGWSWRDTGTECDMLEYMGAPYNNENTYGGVVNSKGQKLVDAIKKGI